MPKKKTYIFTCPIGSAEGWQQWSVEATSKEEAMEAFKYGKTKFVDEEVEVTSLGAPEVTEEE